VSVSCSVTCPGPLLRLSAVLNNNPASSRPFPAHMFPSWDPELKPHWPPPPPLLYPAARAAPPRTLNVPPCSCFLAHGSSLRTYFWWSMPVPGPGASGGKERERGREASRCKKKEKWAVEISDSVVESDNVSFSWNKCIQMTSPPRRADAGSRDYQVLLRFRSWNHHLQWGSLLSMLNELK